MRTFRFRPEVDFDGVQSSALLATLAAEAIHGRTCVRLHARYRIDSESRRLHCDTETPVGETLASVFTLLASRTLGEDAFVIESLEGKPTGHGGNHGS